MRPSPSANAPAPAAELSERALIGALLQDFDIVFPVAQAAGIGVESFTDPTCRKAWETMDKLRTGRKIVDLVTVPEAMGGGAMENAVALGECVAACPTTAHAAYYAEQVREAQQRRKALAATKDAVRALEHGKPVRDLRDLLTEISDPTFPAGGHDFSPSGILTLREFMAEPVPEPPQVIREVLRAGQVGVVASSSKAGKTWLMQSLGLAVATGKMWLAWKTTPGRVLFVDPELCHFDGQSRMRRLMDALGLGDVPEGVDYWRVKGKRLTVADVERHVLKRLQETGVPFALIIVDSIYCFGDGRDENDNAEQAKTMQELYALTEATGAAVVITHHFSKGNQAGKAHIDRMSGAGVFGRAPDAIISLTAHGEKDCYSVESTCRSFKRPEPFVVRWEYPLWKIDADLDPAELLGPKTGRPARFTPEELADLLPAEGLKHGDWAKAAKDALGIGRSQFNAVLKKTIKQGVAVHGFGVYQKGGGDASES